ncbi:hypothetical protein TGFOU_406850 [Toxoplasma gondii FOU]|uniref:Prohibitin n=1 Tax=Toxoplasma gondii FOU TaxID=943167 RepID=A0A086JG19_TOXGO|nr:hypothetical protein TGFOU_406850 [Toxoplasma gondii FOU]
MTALSASDSHGSESLPNWAPVVGRSRNVSGVVDTVCGLASRSLGNRGPGVFVLNFLALSVSQIGNAIKNNPAFLELRRIDTAKEVANTISKSSNRVMLNSDSLLLNLMGKDFKTGVSELTGGK